MSAVIANPMQPRRSDADHRVRTVDGKVLLILLFLFGAAANTAVYWSAAPCAVFVASLAAALLASKVFMQARREELRALLIVALVCWFWAAVSAFYLHVTGPEDQDPDSSYFHSLVIDPDLNPIEDAADLRPQDEGFSVWRLAYDLFSVSLLQNAGAIMVWRVAYKLFGWLGMGDGRYVGVTLNIMFVALSASLGVTMVRAIFGADPDRLARFTAMFAVCGMFWLFGSLHVRDAMALFCVTFLATFWVHYLVAPSLGALVRLVIATAFAFMVFGLIRTEFIFVPFAMLLAGIASRVFGAGERRQGRAWIYALLGMGVLCVVAGALVVFPSVVDTITTLLVTREKVYSAVSMAEGGESLGNQLIVGQTGPIRVLFGSAYMFLHPIPFWGGVFTGSAYHLYKSFNVLFMYFAAPLAALGAWRVARNRSLQRPVLLFIVFCFLGFTASIAYTSLESRHLGAFLVLFLLLASIPDLRRGGDLNGYKVNLSFVMVFVIAVHLAWVAHKIVV